MKNYVTPEFDILVVNITDVIATSGSGTDDGDSSVDTQRGDIEFDASEIFP